MKRHTTTKRRQDAMENYTKLRAELDDVNSRLQESKGRNLDQESKQREHIDLHGKRRVRKKKPLNAHQARMQMRSDLEKMARQIPHKTCHQFHIDHRFKTSLQEQLDQSANSSAQVPVPQEHKLHDCVMSKYADAMAKSPDLRHKKL